MLKKAYLVAYNLASAIGWAYIIFLLGQAYLDKVKVEEGELWARVGYVLTVVQSAAILEVLHALFGIVRSPVLTTALQVSSRLVLVWLYTIESETAQHHWSLWLMVTSWALVEVPRYLFYMVGQFVPSQKIPYWLFWARYNLFMILYPTGISGEMLQMYSSLTDFAVSAPVFYRWTIVLMALYVPGGPYMIMNMNANRVGASRRREMAGRPPRPVDGLVWPITNAKTGERGSTATNRAIWVASTKKVAPEVSQRAASERNWRFGYDKHVLENVRQCLASPKAALTIAQDGLTEAQNLFQFVRNGRTTSLAEAMKLYTDSFATGIIQGEAPKTSHTVSIPYGGKDPSKPYYMFRNNKDVLQGKALIDQLDRWVAYGTIEPSAADAIKSVAAHPDWLDLSDRYFVLLGASSAMGPYEFLLEHGANIIAIDLNLPHIWAGLIKKARASSGRLIFPMRTDQPQSELNDEELAKVSGSNLLSDTPEICNWLRTVCKGERLTIGNYTYLDGALHVQLSLASDAIMQGVCEARPDTALAFLCTPTDVHVIPQQAHEAAIKNRASGPAWLKFLEKITPRKWLVPNTVRPVQTESGSQLYLVDGSVSAQGPNYALAKRLQHWRAVVARSKGHTVSSNIAPSTATRSVVHNAQFAAAYGGMHHMRPMEVMYQETSYAVMGCLLIHDVCNPNGAAQASYKLENPFQLFEHGSFHGGVWRCGYKIGSIGEVSALSYYVTIYKYRVLGFLATAAAVGRWVATGSVIDGF